MKIQRTFSILILLLASIKAMAQLTPIAEVSTGLEFGTWRVIFDDPVRSTNIAVNHSKTTLSIPISLALYMNVQKIQIGIETKNQYLIVEELLPSIDPGNTERVSNGGGVNFTTFLVSMRYPIINNDNYSLLPTLGFGTFIENSSHDQKSEFSKRRSGKLAFQNKFGKSSGMSYFITPQVMINRIMERDILKHSIVTYGVEMGLTIPLQNKSI